MENGEIKRNNLSIINDQLSIPRSARGFTLAELLVSIGIIILFTAVLLPGINKFGRRNELVQTAQFVQSKIRETKSYALAPRSSGSAQIAEYEFRAPVRATQRSFKLGSASCPVSDQNYVILEVTEGEVQNEKQNPPQPYGTVVECGTLPSGIVFNDSTTDGQWLTFDVVKQGQLTCPKKPSDPPDVVCPLPSGGQKVTFTIEQPRLTTGCRRDIVVVKATGQVSVEPNDSC